MTDRIVSIYTDGACRGNPGPGGWGVILRYNDTEKEFFGGELDTTNNRMEMMAVIQALEMLTRSCKVQFYTDSRYVIDGITQWIIGWKKKQWKNSQKKPVKNSDLWKQMDVLVQNHEISWHWVKGHAGHIENERADELANLGVDSILSTKKSGN